MYRAFHLIIQLKSLSLFPFSLYFFFLKKKVNHRVIKDAGLLACSREVCLAHIYL